ncbi:unnamed protein product [Echinostoma caproni]|uniref:Uncharacterized protein n=1 Tax=Echinostoma caproni TaxID=27848 RepID=A0A3P8AY37_9TREM|nr:unnamed protein product [Echinostoma caproni]
MAIGEQVNHAHTEVFKINWCRHDVHRFFVFKYVICSHYPLDIGKYQTAIIAYAPLPTSELNLATPVNQIEQRLSKAFAIAHANSIKNYSSGLIPSLEIYEAKVAQMRLLRERNKLELTFFVKKEQDYISAIEVMQTFARMSLQELAIILGIQLVQKPQNHNVTVLTGYINDSDKIPETQEICHKFYDLEAYNEVDDFLWIIGARWVQLTQQTTMLKYSRIVLGKSKSVDHISLTPKILNSDFPSRRDCTLAWFDGLRASMALRAIQDGFSQP